MNRYEAKHHDEMSFEKGVLVEVFEKGIDGWWKIRYAMVYHKIFGPPIIHFDGSKYFITFGPPPYKQEG